MARTINIPSGQEHDLDDRQVDIFDPEVPANILAAALEYWQPGYSLWRCPSYSGPRGLFGLGSPQLVIEWWLFDADGELIDVFWDE